MSEYPTTPLTTYREYPVDEMRRRVTEFYEEINRRRTVRNFSDRHVPRDIIETALHEAGLATLTHTPSLIRETGRLSKPFPDRRRNSRTSFRVKSDGWSDSFAHGLRIVVYP